MAWTSIFTNGNSSSSQQSLSSGSTPGNIRGTLIIKGTWDGATLVVSATGGATPVAGWPVFQKNQNDAKSEKVDIDCNSLQFDIEGGGSDTSLDVEFGVV